MSKKFLILLFTLFALSLILYLLWPSDESRIRKLFKEGSKAIEKEDLDAVMSKVSFNYRDEYGMTYLYVKESMKSVFRQMSDIRIEYENLKIKVNDKNATADMDVRVLATIGNNTGYILGDLAKPAHLRFTLEKERAKWLVTKTEGLPFENLLYTLSDAFNAFSYLLCTLSTKHNYRFPYSIYGEAEFLSYSNGNLFHETFS